MKHILTGTTTVSIVLAGQLDNIYSQDVKPFQTFLKSNLDWDMAPVTRSLIQQSGRMPRRRLWFNNDGSRDLTAVHIRCDFLNEKSNNNIAS